MSESTPYAPPKAAVADQNTEYAEVKVFSASGRLNRARYIAYSMGMLFLGYALVGAVSAVTIGLQASNESAAGGIMAGGSMLIFVVVMIVVSALFGIRRLHDMDRSGWLWLLMLVPFVNYLFGLYLMAWPGTRGANRFGNPPPPNSTGVLVLAWLVPGVAIIGILAAIAIPAYQDYTQRAHAQQMQRPAAP